MLRAALCAGLCAGPLSGCFPRGGDVKLRLPDKARPADVQSVANFKALFELPLHSRPVFALPKEPGLMDRLLLSPNLVFESSRSSLEEPKTVGPAGATRDAPWLPDALGEPVDIKLSTILMNYLSEKKSKMLAPVLSRRWGWEAGCTKETCQNTWVERLILLQQKTPAQGDKPAAETHAKELPTAAFAVRRLGIAHDKIQVTVVAGSEGQELVFRPAAASGEASLCPALSLKIPVVAFMAEIVSLRDGRILARIDEQRVARTTLDARRRFVTVAWRAVEQQDFTRNDLGHTAAYAYVADWQQVDVRCAQAAKAYDEVRRAFEAELAARLPDAVAEILKTTLDPLY